MKFLVVLYLCLVIVLAEQESQELSSSAIQLEARITHAKLARAGQFPYLACLKVKYIFIPSWCGGSLIDAKWVVTAAHCTAHVTSIIVQLGGTKCGSPEIYRTVTRKSIYQHPDYSLKTKQNDIALLKIEPVRFSRTIKPIRIPSLFYARKHFLFQRAIISGWGQTQDDTLFISSHLRWGEVTIVRDKVCSKFYDVFRDDKMICASTPNGISTCHGDSGGPLVLKKKAVLIGVTSFGDKAGCEIGSPIVFTRLTNYLRWIREVSGVY